MATHLLDLADLGPEGVAKVLALCSPSLGTELGGSSVAMVF